jgi:hypothetical protein
MGEWRKVHNELRDLHSSPSVIRIIRSKRIDCNTLFSNAFSNAEF